MISTVQLDALKKLHHDHIAHTFLFTAKVLEQYRRITDVQVEVLHGVLCDFSTVAAMDGVDPLALARNAAGQITRSLVNQNERSGTYMAETAGAYAEIMRLIVDYANDSFAGVSCTRNEIGALGGGLSAQLQDAWTASFVNAFQGAVNLMTGMIGASTAEVAGTNPKTAAGTHGVAPPDATAGRAGKPR